MSASVEETERALQLLRELGERRLSLREDRELLQADTKRIIGEVRGIVPVTVAAKLAGLNRSTVYELYIAKESNGNPD